jgi:hypothetical protein
MLDRLECILSTDKCSLNQIVFKTRQNIENNQFLWKKKKNFFLKIPQLIMRLNALSDLYFVRYYYITRFFYNFIYNIFFSNNNS